MTSGPLFQTEAKEPLPAKVKELDVLFHKYLFMVQDSFPHLIPATIDVSEMYSLSRSLRRGSTAQARNQGVPRDIISMNNRWRSEEASRSHSAVPGDMLELYSDVVVALEALLRYSTPL